MSNFVESEVEPPDIKVVWPPKIVAGTLTGALQLVWIRDVT